MTTPVSSQPLGQQEAQYVQPVKNSELRFKKLPISEKEPSQFEKEFQNNYDEFSNSWREEIEKEVPKREDNLQDVFKIDNIVSSLFSAFTPSGDQELKPQPQFEDNQNLVEDNPGWDMDEPEGIDFPKNDGIDFPKKSDVQTFPKPDEDDDFSLEEEGIAFPQAPIENKPLFPEKQASSNLKSEDSDPQEMDIFESFKKKVTKKDEIAPFPNIIEKADENKHNISDEIIIDEEDVWNNEPDINISNDEIAQESQGIDFPSAPVKENLQEQQKTDEDFEFKEEELKEEMEIENEDKGWDNGDIDLDLELDEEENKQDNIIDTPKEPSEEEKDNKIIEDTNDLKEEDVEEPIKEDLTNILNEETEEENNLEVVESQKEEIKIDTSDSKEKLVLSNPDNTEIEEEIKPDQNYIHETDSNNIEEWEPEETKNINTESKEKGLEKELNTDNTEIVEKEQEKEEKIQEITKESEKDDKKDDKELEELNIDNEDNWGEELDIDLAPEDIPPEVVLEENKEDLDKDISPKDIHKEDKSQEGDLLNINNTTKNKEEIIEETKEDLKEEIEWEEQKIEKVEVHQEKETPEETGSAQDNSEIQDSEVRFFKLI